MLGNSHRLNFEYQVHMVKINQKKINSKLILQDPLVDQAIRLENKEERMS